MKNKFITNITLSNKDIKGKRADLLGDDAKDAQEELVRELKAKERELKRTLMNLEDLSPDATTSLHPTKTGFNAKQWVKDVQETKLAIKLISVEIVTAEETSKEYFEEESVKDE